VDEEAAITQAQALVAQLLKLREKFYQQETITFKWDPLQGYWVALIPTA
jgi:hypothetical protein